MSQEKPTVKIVFDNQEAAMHFISWLCENEQQYWQWMEYREEEEDGDITAVEFDYWGGTGKGENFGKDLTITTKCARLDK